MRRPRPVWTALAAALVLGAALAPPPRAAGERAGEPVTWASRFGRLTSRRWAWGQRYRRENLVPVANPHPAPESQPRREHPFDAAVTPDGRKVYVSLLGSESQPGSALAVYDVVRDTVSARILLKPEGESGPPASGPFRLTMHPGGRYLLVTNRLSNFASVVDTRTDRVVSEIPLDFYAQGAVFSADGRVAFVANRYLDQVLVLDVAAGPGAFRASLRELGGMDTAAFFGGKGRAGIHDLLSRLCASCHANPDGSFYAGPDRARAFDSAMSHLVPGKPQESRLLRAVVRTRDGGYADKIPKLQGHPGGVIFTAPRDDPEYRRLSSWIAAGADGPGIPVGNPSSKPKVAALSTDGRWLFVGNTGTQEVSVVDARRLREVGSIYLQNVANDIKVYHSSVTGRDYLLVTTLGAGFGVAKERDPYGAESWERDNPAAHFTLWRDLRTGKPLPRSRQRTLGPFDAVDGTAAFKFRDAQNDLLFVDVGALGLPPEPPGSGSEPPGPGSEPPGSGSGPPAEPKRLLLAHRYEAHRGWVRYTSDTAESTHGDLKGDVPPDLMRVVGALPEKLALSGDRLFVTMQGTNEVQEWRVDPAAAEASDALTPVRTYRTGWQPVGLAAGPPGTPARGKLFTANFLGGSLSVIDRDSGASREVLLDPSVLARPVPDTNAERGEMFAHTAMFSSDRDSSCVHCHYFDMGDGRPWGVSQVMGQEYLTGKEDEEGQIAIGGTMGVPQMRALFAIQPFFYEGVISAFEPRSMIMEHAPAEDFGRATPQGDFAAVEAHVPLAGAADLQSAMWASAKLQSTLEERRDEMFRTLSARHFGKAFTLRDFQRFVGEWQIHEPRLLPVPFDRANASARRGERLFNDPQVGCVSCHPPPHFAKKDFPGNRQQAFPPLVTLTARDAAFTLVGMNRLDAINGIVRDLEPWDYGRAEETEGHFTSFQLRGLWDRPPVFLHNGMARSLREVLATPGHPGLGSFRYEPLIGGVPERPGRREVGFNETFVFTGTSPRTRAHEASGARMGIDTHGGTSQLTAGQLEDLARFLETLE